MNYAAYALYDKILTSQSSELTGKPEVSINLEPSAYFFEQNNINNIRGGRAIGY